MPQKNFEIFEHTADIGLRVRGRDLCELFRNAGLAIFALSCRRHYVRNKNRFRLKVEQRALSREELFVNWLNELLSLSSAKGLVFHNIKIKSIEPTFIEAYCFGSDIANYKVNIELKAATYHGLSIREDSGGWLAEVIIDV